MVYRLVANGMSAKVGAVIINTFRILPDGPTTSNGIYHMCKETMRGAGYGDSWVFGSMPAIVARDVANSGVARNPHLLDVHGFKTEFELFPERGGRGGGSLQEWKFADLAKGLKKMPEGDDALDLTRMVQYAVDHPEDNFVFPNDYDLLLQLVGGPAQPTAQHFDAAVFDRWDKVRGYHMKDYKKGRVVKSNSKGTGKERKKTDKIMKKALKSKNFARVKDSGDKESDSDSDSEAEAKVTPNTRELRKRNEGIATTLEHELTDNDAEFVSDSEYSPESSNTLDNSFEPATTSNVVPDELIDPFLLQGGYSSPSNVPPPETTTSNVSPPVSAPSIPLTAPPSTVQAANNAFVRTIHEAVKPQRRSKAHPAKPSLVIKIPNVKKQKAVGGCASPSNHRVQKPYQASVPQTKYLSRYIAKSQATPDMKKAAMEHLDEWVAGLMGMENDAPAAGSNTTTPFEPSTTSPDVGTSSSINQGLDTSTDTTSDPYEFFASLGVTYHPAPTRMRQATPPLSKSFSNVVPETAGSFTEAPVPATTTFPTDGFAFGLPPGHDQAFATAPAMESVPAVASAPAMDSVPTFANASFMNSVPAFVSAPAMGSVPAFATAPVMNNVPAFADPTPTPTPMPMPKASPSPSFSDFVNWNGDTVIETVETETKTETEPESKMDTSPEMVVDSDTETDAKTDTDLKPENEMGYEVMFTPLHKLFITLHPQDMSDLAENTRFAQFEHKRFHTTVWTDSHPHLQMLNDQRMALEWKSEERRMVELLDSDGDSDVGLDELGREPTPALDVKEEDWMVERAWVDYDDMTLLE
jgi:hypothetical protein